MKREDNMHYNKQDRISKEDGKTKRTSNINRIRELNTGPQFNLIIPSQTP